MKPEIDPRMKSEIDALFDPTSTRECRNCGHAEMHDVLLLDDEAGASNAPLVCRGDGCYCIEAQRVIADLLAAQAADSAVRNSEALRRRERAQQAVADRRTATALKEIHTAAALIQIVVDAALTTRDLLGHPRIAIYIPRDMPAAERQDHLDVLARHFKWFVSVPTDDPKAYIRMLDSTGDPSTLIDATEWIALLSKHVAHSLSIMKQHDDQSVRQ